MNMHTDVNGQVLNGSRRKSAIIISKTIWGYTIIKGGSASARASVGEIFAIIGCLFFGAASFGQWLIPGSMYAGDLFPFKVSGTIMFFVFSALLYLIARRGLLHEVQVDTKNDSVRLARRNREGSATVVSKFAFADISSVYIKRSKSNLIGNQMFMRSKSSASPILIATGPVGELEPLLDMIQKDFRGQMQRAPTDKPVTAPVQTPKPARVRSAFAAG